MTFAPHSTFGPRIGRWAAATLVLLLSGCGMQVAQSASATTTTGSSGETIVLVRHGEKQPNGLGQLNCMGLNRSLALPGVLIGRFGPANAIFAPDPADQIAEGAPRQSYSYVRPLETIEPTAIELGLPVNTQLSYQDITGLQTAVTAPQYAKSTIYIAWEHHYAQSFAQQMVRSYGQDPSMVPAWSDNDYETMYIFSIAPNPAGSGPGELTFQVEQEGLTGSLSSVCPGAPATP